METMPYKDVLRYAMGLERHSMRTLADYIGLTPKSVQVTLGSRCGMTMENYLRYCDALNLKLYAEWEDPRGRQPKVRFRIE